MIKREVKVTFHREMLFRATFPSFFENLDQIHASLAPKHNRNMVFKAGEGAGRSGSFFFFSHDRRFLIKTMNKGEMELLLKIMPSM